MPTEPRYLLGYGERLTGRVAAPLGGGAPDLPYTMEEAMERLAPRLEATNDALQAVPADACPMDRAVAVFTLHPQSIAKSYFPGQLLTQFGLWRVGSRPTIVTPEQWTRKGDVAASPSTDLFVAGPRASFSAFADATRAGNTEISDGLRRIEDIRSFAFGERLRGLAPEGKKVDKSEDLVGFANMEVVLHAADTAEDGYVVESFADYADQLGVDAQLGRRLYAGGLCFIPVIAPFDQLEQLSEFAFLRVARPVSKLREISAPIER